MCDRIGREVKPEEKARNRCRKVSILTGFLVIAMAAALVFIVTRPQRIELPEGTTLTWLGVTVGTNAYEHGTAIERLLGRRIPANGMAIGGLKFRRPQVFVSRSKNAPVTAWLMMEGALVKGARFYAAGAKVIAANSTGRELENPSVWPYPMGSTNQLLLAVPLVAFPRDEGHVRLRLSPSKKQWEERRWVEFRFRNPLRTEAARWEPSEIPVTNHVRGGEFILTRVALEPTRLRFKIPRGWRMAQCRIEDEEGNSYRNTLRPLMDGHGGVRAIFAHSLERDRTWKVSARLVGALRNISWGESPSDSGGFHSNHDLRIEIAEGSELTVTNAVGARYRCRFDEQTLSIRRIEQGQEGTRFIVARATDEVGREVGLYDESTLKNLAIQRLGGQSWRVEKGVARISVCAVVPEEVEAEFYIRAKESAQE